MGTTCHAVTLLLATTLCSAGVYAASPATSHARLMLRPVLRGGGDVGSSHPPTHYVSISDSDQTAVQLQVPAEDGTDGKTAEPLPGVAE